MGPGLASHGPGIGLELALGPRWPPVEVGAHPPTPTPTPRVCVGLLRGTQCSPFTMINAIHRGGTGATLTMPPPLLDCSVPNAPGIMDTQHFCEPPISRVTAGGDGRKGERNRRGHRQMETQEPETQSVVERGQWAR